MCWQVHLIEEEEDEDREDDDDSKNEQPVEFVEGDKGEPVNCVIQRVMLAA